jgi:uncharacterized protein YqhQ
MVRGRRAVAIALRRPEGSLALYTWPLPPLFRGWWRHLPIVRGLLALVETLVLGMRALTFSAQVASGYEGRPTPVEAWITMGGALVVAVGVFLAAPLAGAKALLGLGFPPALTYLLEGIARLGLFLAYLWLIGRWGEIRRVFGYHAAEHMAIHAYEGGRPLRPQEVARLPAAHPRCGTAFLLVVAALAMVAFPFLGDRPLWEGTLFRLGLLPLLASLSYEALRWGWGRAGHPVARWLVKPGLALQALTTRPPSPDQIEVAIAAMRLALGNDGIALSEEGAILHTAHSTTPQGEEHGPGD